ncbi:MAG TPA: beta-propeller fold lactonase family protein [Tepidisphaeraceae bacterium]|nr:beta-propeller fold lactonase family protein [Tepidisphaeraceae bacterium]
MSRLFDRFTPEPLESRTLLSATWAFDGAPHPVGPLFTTVYTETNNPTSGQNAVLAFRRNPFDGSLHQIGSFATGGTGQGNPTEMLGPDDSDQEVVATADKRFLLAVNQGSNTVTVFRIRLSGALHRVGTFDSGGVQPVSVGISGNKVYVVNRGNALGTTPGNAVPNISAFKLDRDGSLDLIPGATVSLPNGSTEAGLSPSQALVSPDGRLLFADLFGIPGTTPADGSTIDPFQINPDGTLTQSPGGLQGATGVTPPFLLGLASHPTLPIVYAGLVGANEVAVFTHSPDGSLKFITAVSDQGKGVCWITVSSNGKYMYVANTGSDSIGVYSLANPLAPRQIQEFKLAGPYAPPGLSAGTLQANAFQLALDPTNRSLYVITQAQSQSFPGGNALHELSVGPDGMLSENDGPIIFSQDDVPATARPQGVAVVGGFSVELIPDRR